MKVINTVKPLFERHFYFNATSNRTPLQRKVWKIELHPLIERHFDEFFYLEIVTAEISFLPCFSKNKTYLKNKT